MPDDNWSMDEVVRHLKRLEDMLRDLMLRVVSQDVYSRDQREVERRITEIERDLAEERQARKDEVKEIKAQLDKQSDKQSTNWRQALFAGLIPGIFFLVTILLQLKGGGK